MMMDTFDGVCHVEVVTLMDGVCHAVVVGCRLSVGLSVVGCVGCVVGLSAVGCVVGLLLLLRHHVVNEAMIRVLKQISWRWIAEIRAEICAKRFSDPNLESTRLIVF
jgi:hypothetical protein